MEKKEECNQYSCLRIFAWGNNCALAIANCLLTYRASCFFTATFSLKLSEIGSGIIMLRTDF